MIYCRRYICIVCYCLPVNVCPSILVCNVKNQRIVLSDNSYRRYFISKCSKCKHSFSKQQNLIYFREPYLLIRYKHVDGEEKLLTILKREERRKKKERRGTLFYIHSEKLIRLFTHCGSCQVVHFQKSQTLCSYEFT